MTARRGAGLYDRLVGRPRTATTAAASTLALLLAGCSTQDRALAPACTGEPEAVLAALRRAPEPVTLRDGTKLSACISVARSAADLQTLGITLVRVADSLRGRAAGDDRAALQLGYLAGAVQAGARHASGGIAGQLARRVEQVAALGPDAPRASREALQRGLRAGSRVG